MAKRVTSKPSNFERTYKIIEYLKKHTDSVHKVTQADLRKSLDVKEYIGDKQTFNRMVNQAAVTMNEDKSEDDWLLVFDEYSKRYGDNYDFDLFEEESDDYDDMEQSLPIRGLYYNHIFSYEDINNIVESIVFSKTLDTETTNRLINKIEENLTTKYYKSGYKKLCKVLEPEILNRDVVRGNLATIQTAIDDRVQISFKFNGYTVNKQLKPTSDFTHTLSPYYIVANSGKFYLLGCKEIVRDEESIKNMSIWRIDLMSDIEITNRNEELGLKGLPIIKKSDVKNLPSEWSQDFQLSHINMSFDRPLPIKLKLNVTRETEFTFLHDWFGDNFKCSKIDNEYYVTVKCSPFGMVNWALQYSDRVEVLEPLEVRNAVIEKIRNLNGKYGV